jgi:hypothetical protein
MDAGKVGQRHAMRHAGGVSAIESGAGTYFSIPSALVLAGVIAGALASGYGARERPVHDLAVEVLIAAGVAGLVVGVVPLALALSRCRADATAAVIALCSAGAGAIHFAVIRDHFDEYWFYGLFFVVTGLTQLVWAAAIVLRPTKVLIALGMLVNGAIIASWVVTRTVGLLIGPGADEVEPVGLADALATGFEVVIVLGGMFLFMEGERSLRLSLRQAEALTWALSLITAAATTLGLLSAVGAASSVLPPAG